MNSSGFCIYINTLCQGPVPVVTEGKGKYVVFETELEAQREVADYAMTRLHSFWTVNEILTTQSLSKNT